MSLNVFFLLDPPPPPPPQVDHDHDTLDFAHGQWSKLTILTV